MGQPTVLDVYTTGAAGARQTVFAPGEAIQFNLVHTLSPDLPVGTLYEATWILQRYQQLHAFSDDDDFELLVDVRRMISYDGNYVGRSIITWWNTVLPVAFPGELNVETNRAQALDLLGDDLFFALSLPGLWTLTGTVELTEAYTGRPFSALSGWHFRINA